VVFVWTNEQEDEYITAKKEGELFARESEAPKKLVVEPRVR
jgi:hypothetical protein